MITFEIFSRFGSAIYNFSTLVPPVRFFPKLAERRVAIDDRQRSYQQVRRILSKVTQELTVLDTLLD
jgi:hypothetical protein